MTKTFTQLLVLAIILTLPAITQARPTNGEVLGFTKIAEQTNGFDINLDDGDSFGDKLDEIGDLDNNGVIDFIVGNDQDDDNGSAAGSAYIIMLNTDGTVKDYQKLSGTEGGLAELGAVIETQDRFGQAVAGVGDFDGDGIEDVLVAAERDDDGGSDAGAAYLIFLNIDGTAKAYQQIRAGLDGMADASTARMGSAAKSIGDLDGDGVTDIAIGARDDDGDGNGGGAVWIIFLNENGTAKGYQKISDTEGGFTADIENNDWFGGGIALLSDMNGDGIQDLAVGAFGDDDGSSNRGAIYILFMDTDGTVKSHLKYSDTEGDLGDFDILNSARWGGRLESVDMNDDGILDIIAPREGWNRFDIIILTESGLVDEIFTVIAEDYLTVGEEFEYSDIFGGGVAAVGDVNGDNIQDLAVGARRDDGDGSNEGAVYIVFMDEIPSGGGASTIKSLSRWTGSVDDDQDDDVETIDRGEIDEKNVEEFEEVEGAEEDGEISERRTAIIRLILQILVERLQ